MLNSLGVYSLMNAVIDMAINDYKDHARRRARGAQYSRKRMQSIVEFFRSEWFYELSWGVNGEWVVKQLDEYVVSLGGYVEDKARPPRKITNEEAREIISMKDSGMSWAEIAKVVDRNPGTCQNAYRRYKERVEVNDKLGSERKAVAVIDN